MEKHTPGPWEVQPNEGRTDPNRHVIYAIGPNREWLREVAAAPKWESDGIGNARLIAAAPELLELLESCIRVMQRADEISGDARYFIELGTLAIAKAKGIAS